MTTPTLPPLTWGPRPEPLACQAPGCGRKPLCGFTDEAREVFLCAVCWDDDSTGTSSSGWRQPAPSARRPRFRTAAERKRILEGSSR